MKFLRFLLLLVLVGGGVWYWYSFLREPDWAALAAKDIDHIYSTLRDSHPGPVDEDNPGFSKALEQARADALARAEKVNSSVGHFYAKRSMSLAFQDAHLVDGLYALPERVQRWPGFLVGPNDEGGLSVVHRESDVAPDLGARQLSCDGKKVPELIAERITPYIYNSWLPSKQPGDHYLILIDTANPFLEVLSTCLFDVDGVETSYDLTWQVLDVDKDDALSELMEPSGERITELRFLSDGTVWISIGSFTDFFSSDRQVVDDLLADIRSNRDRIAAAPALVLDVRENNGGATAVGLEIAGAIWGDDYIQDIAPRHTSTDWRASEFNLSETEKILARLAESFGEESDLYQRILPMKIGIEGALAAGEDYFVQEIDHPAQTGAPALTVPSQIYFLTDHNCVSACLDFADLMMVLPDVVHVGQETAGDTAYLEVIASVLPSKTGQLSFPVAVHRGRARGNNETYLPAHPWSGNITDTAALETWIADLRVNLGTDLGADGSGGSE